MARMELLSLVEHPDEAQRQQLQRQSEQFMEQQKAVLRPWDPLPWAMCLPSSLMWVRINDCGRPQIVHGSTFPIRLSS